MNLQSYKMHNTKSKYYKLELLEIKALKNHKSRIYRNEEI